MKAASAFRSGLTGAVLLMSGALVPGALVPGAASAEDAKMVDGCQMITLGAAISLTGKYATNGIHAKNGYEYAISKIKENGGVEIDGKCHNFEVIYYDDESKGCLLYTSPSPRDLSTSRMPSSA